MTDVPLRRASDDALQAAAPADPAPEDPVAGVGVDPREIDAEMIAGLYRRTGPLIVANFGALTLLTLALWGKAAMPWLAIWAGALAAWTLLRYVLARVYLRRPRALEDTWRWTLAFAVGSTVAGCLWGSSVAFAGDLATDSSKLVTAFLMAALSAAAIAGYTNSLLAFAGFIAPALLPYAVRLVYLDGSLSLTIAAFVVFWGLLLWVMAKHLNAGFRESLALGLRNRNLALRLRDERDRAEAASQAKSRFLGHMSHELRTPLNHIIGYAEMMAHQLFGPLGNAKYSDYAGDIHDSGRHLLGLVDGMLDVTELETGGVELALQPVPLDPLLPDAAAAWRDSAEDTGLSLHTEVPAGLPQPLGDAARLRQALDILLSNAVRFTDAGGRVALTAAATGNGGVRIAVADTGVGMTPAQAARVQVPFAQLEDRDPYQRTAGELGGPTSTRLSVPLAKLIAERMGAAFAIDSAPGAGTEVSLTFPPERSVT